MTQTADRAEQKKFLAAAITWLEHYPDTSRHIDGNYSDTEDTEFAERIAAFLAVQLRAMTGEA